MPKNTPGKIPPLDFADKKKQTQKVNKISVETFFAILRSYKSTSPFFGHSSYFLSSIKDGSSLRDKQNEKHIQALPQIMMGLVSIYIFLDQLADQGLLKENNFISLDEIQVCLNNVFSGGPVWIWAPLTKKRWVREFDWDFVSMAYFRQPILKFSSGLSGTQAVLLEIKRHGQRDYQRFLAYLEIVNTCKILKPGYKDQRSRSLLGLLSLEIMCCIVGFLIRDYMKYNQHLDCEHEKSTRHEEMKLALQ